MEITKISVTDAEQLLNFFRKLVEFDTKRVERAEDVAKITLENEKNWIQSRIADEEKQEMFVLCAKDKNGDIVAEGEVERKKRWIERHVAEIRFGVLPGFEKVAKEMVEQLIQIASKNDLEVLFYFHLQTQQSGITIMKELGFSEVGSIKNYYKLSGNSYVDRLYFSKQLITP